MVFFTTDDILFCFSSLRPIFYSGFFISLDWLKRFYLFPRIIFEIWNFYDLPFHSCVYNTVVFYMLFVFRLQKVCKLSFNFIDIRCGIRFYIVSIFK